MIQLIETDLGIFGNFLDLAKFMYYETVKEVTVKSVKLWSGDYMDMFKGHYSSEEIYKVAEWKGEDK